MADPQPAPEQQRQTVFHVSVLQNGDEGAQVRAINALREIFQNDPQAPTDAALAAGLRIGESTDSAAVRYSCLSMVTELRMRSPEGRAIAIAQFEASMKDPATIPVGLQLFRAMTGQSVESPDVVDAVVRTAGGASGAVMREFARDFAVYDEKWRGPIEKQFGPGSYVEFLTRFASTPEANHIDLVFDVALQKLGVPRPNRTAEKPDPAPRNRRSAGVEIDPALIEQVLTAGERPLDFLADTLRRGASVVCITGLQTHSSFARLMGELVQLHHEGLVSHIGFQAGPATVAGLLDTARYGPPDARIEIDVLDSVVLMGYAGFRPGAADVRPEIVRGALSLVPDSLEVFGFMPSMENSGGALTGDLAHDQAVSSICSRAKGGNRVVVIGDERIAGGNAFETDYPSLGDELKDRIGEGDVRTVLAVSRPYLDMIAGEGHPQLLTVANHPEIRKEDWALPAHEGSISEIPWSPVEPRLTLGQSFDAVLIRPDDNNRPGDDDGRGGGSRSPSPTSGRKLVLV